MYLPSGSEFHTFGGISGFMESIVCVVPGSYGFKVRDWDFGVTGGSVKLRKEFDCRLHPPRIAPSLSPKP